MYLHVHMLDIEVIAPQKNLKPYTQNPISQKAASQENWNKPWTKIISDMKNKQSRQMRFILWGSQKFLNTSVKTRN